jgi:hypothetical protein
LNNKDTKGTKLAVRVVGVDWGFARRTLGGLAVWREIPLSQLAKL